jgi:IS605 OrfB family transposase
VAAGDVWAALIELNETRFHRRARPVFSYQELCREVAGVEVGGLSVPALRSVLRRYSDACFETARRKRAGEKARYPRRRRHSMPLRYYRGTFELSGQRLRLSMARGAAPLWLRLSRPVPYPIDAVRSVTLLLDAGRLVVDVCAEVPVEDHGLDPARIAGVDPGIIHPFALTWADQALLVSGRAVRAEERLHLADTKARSREMAKKAPKRGQRGSRRWRQLRANQRKAEATHRRRVHQAHHEAARVVIDWAIEHQIGTLVVGDPKGITQRDGGRHQNRRVNLTWRRSHLVGALGDKARQAGITVVLIDERGTSSECPECQESVSKPKGRVFVCPHCQFRGHRDLVGSRNIAARRGGITTAPAVVTHRRAGHPPARRDRRRHQMDERRSCPAPGRPTTAGSRSPEPTRHGGNGSTQRGHGRGSVNSANVC